ncbi:MAG: acyltransferase family protein [Elainella sp.]
MQRNNSQLSTRQLANRSQAQDSTQIAMQIKREMSKILFTIRGMAILFVVIGHVIGESTSGIRQLYPDSAGLAQIYDFIYTFHMPIFFIASGLSFALFSYGRSSSLGGFLVSRFKRLLVPLLCWAPAYFILRCVTGQAEFTVSALLKAIFIPDFIFWFFHALFLISVISYVILRYGSTAIYFIASILLLLISFLLDGMISAIFYFNFFHAVGFLLGWELQQADHLPFSSLKQPALMAVIGVTGVTMLAVFWGLEEKFYSVAKLLNGLIGFGLLYWVALFGNLNRLSVQHSKIMNWFGHLGRISMSIYLLHVLFGSVARMVLVKLGVMAPILQLTLGVVIALLGPVALDTLLRPRLKLFLYSIGEAKA